MRLERTAFVAAVAVGAAACSLLTKSSDLVGGERDGGETDVTTAPTDASQERGDEPDVSTSDGGSDGADAAFDATPRVCERYPDATFCDDFDPPQLGPPWDDVSPLVGTLVVDASSSPFSPPFFLESTVGPQAQNGFGPRLRKMLGVRSVVTIRARVRVEPNKISYPLRISALTAESHDIRLRHDGTATAIEEVDYTLSQSTTGNPFAKSLDGTWQEVVVKVTFSTRTVEVTVGGTAAVTQLLAIGDWTTTPDVSVHVGLPFVVATDASVTGAIDDVVMIAQ